MPGLGRAADVVALAPISRLIHIQEASFEFSKFPLDIRREHSHNQVYDASIPARAGPEDAGALGRSEGGRRAKGCGKTAAWHRGRADFSQSHPGLVTIRVRRDVPSLRTVRLVREVEHSFRAIAKRADFRVIHYSLQNDHVHLLIETESAVALGNGMKSLAARLARAVNRVFDRRGAVLDGRYHHRALGTPREVRAALAYVLLNARKHAGQRVSVAPNSDCWVDPASSGRWFEGWARCPAPPADRPAVARAETWLLRAGWRRHGLIRSDEVPGGERRHGRSRI